MTSLKPVDGVGSLIRMASLEGCMATYVEVHLGSHRALLPLPTARALLGQLTARLSLAEKIEAGHREKDGPPPLHERRWSSDLTVTLDVVHDDSRHELVEVVAARLGGILEREGCDVWGSSVTAEPNIRERAAEEGESAAQD